MSYCSTHISVTAVSSSPLSLAAAREAGRRPPSASRVRETVVLPAGALSLVQAVRHASRAKVGAAKRRALCRVIRSVKNPIFIVVFLSGCSYFISPHPVRNALHLKSFCR